MNELIELGLLPDIIAHYTNIEIAVTKIIFKNKMRFSQYYKSNDPFENIELNATYGGMVNRSLSEETRNINRKLTSDSIQVVIDRIKNMFISCFCESEIINESLEGNCAVKPRMWIQYGANHTGACLLFSKSELIKNVNDKYLSIREGRIDYLSFYELNDRYPHADIDMRIRMEKDKYDKMLLDGLYKNYVFTKHIDFKSENEYRIVIEEQMEIDSGIYIPIKNAIKGIVVSIGLDPFFEKSIIQYGKENSIPVFSIEWIFREPYIQNLN